MCKCMDTKGVIGMEKMRGWFIAGGMTSPTASTGASRCPNADCDGGSSGASALVSTGEAAVPARQNTRNAPMAGAFRKCMVTQAVREDALRMCWWWDVYVRSAAESESYIWGGVPVDALLCRRFLGDGRNTDSPMTDDDEGRHQRVRVSVGKGRELGRKIRLDSVGLDVLAVYVFRKSGGGDQSKDFSADAGDHIIQARPDPGNTRELWFRLMTAVPYENNRPNGRPEDVEGKKPSKH
ncbi:hypothetical protein BXZ70DRAFT_1076659 [Cristinia sonorae]|uniref:Uncharacterized protein n=1 Tax=Cristinia sonorae TaxID=1940300 RepID=A0A8K0UT67_9AGAR|nr:hypothetical protein BXZ70DRAFT_1076659 [Cristinia sonorae]